MPTNNMEKTEIKNSNKGKNEKSISSQAQYEKILDLDKNTGFLIPSKWKPSSINRKKDYIAIIIGLSNRYELERVFCEKIEFESEEDDQHIGIGFDRNYFKDDLIIEEKFSYREKNTFITKINYYKISLEEDGSVYGIKMSKSKIKEHFYNARFI